MIDCIPDLKHLGAMLMAGGKGSRLHPLTEDNSKPAVPFAGKFRIIDFSLYNLINSGILKTLVLTQYKSASLEEHLSKMSLNDSITGRSVISIGPQVPDKSVYTGTANAVLQNMQYFMKMSQIEAIAIASGDHIYKMDFAEVYKYHIKQEADFTICGSYVEPSEAKHFGIMEVNDAGEVVGFVEKPESDPPIAPNGKCFASMGIYIGGKQFLFDELKRDDDDKNSDNDIGSNVIPSILERQSGKVVVWDFMSHTIKGENGPFWRDVGRLETLLEVNMELIKPKPYLNIYNDEWPLPTAGDQMGPAKAVPIEDDSDPIPDDWPYKPLGMIHAGRFVYDWPSNIYYVAAGRNIKVGRFCDLDHTVLGNDITVGRKVRTKRTFIKDGAIIHGGVDIGFDVKADEARGIYVEPGSGIRVVPSDAVIYPYETDESDELIAA